MNRPALQIEDWFYLAEGQTSVRSSTIDQNLLLLDGAPVFTLPHLFGLFTPDLTLNGRGEWLSPMNYR